MFQNAKYFLLGVFSAILFLVVPALLIAKFSSQQTFSCQKFPNGTLVQRILDHSKKFVVVGPGKEISGSCLINLSDPTGYADMYYDAAFEESK